MLAPAGVRVVYAEILRGIIMTVVTTLASFPCQPGNEASA